MNDDPPNELTPPEILRRLSAAQLTELFSLAEHHAPGALAAAAKRGAGALLHAIDDPERPPGDWSGPAMLAGEVLKLSPEDLERLFAFLGAAFAELAGAPRLRARQHLAHSTAPWAASLHAGYTSIGEDRYEIATLEHGTGLLSPETKRGQLRFAPAPSAAGLAAAFPGIDAADADELAGILKRDGRLKGSVVAAAAVQFTVAHPYEFIAWEDRFRATFGWKRPGGRSGEREDVLTKSRQDFDRLLYSRLNLGQAAEQVGQLFSHGDHEVGVARLYTIGRKVLRPDGLPRLIRFDPAGISADILKNPERSEVIGSLNDILALPDTTPGRWATAMIVFLLDFWSQRATKAECHTVKRDDGSDGLTFDEPVTRAFMFKCLPPDPPSTPSKLLSQVKHAARAPAYFDEAVALLIDAKLVGACTITPTRYYLKHGREPWPGTNPDGTTRRPARGRGVDWRKEWWQQPLRFEPAGLALAQLLERRRKKTAGLNRGR